MFILGDHAVHIHLMILLDALSGTLFGSTAKNVSHTIESAIPVATKVVSANTVKCQMERQMMLSKARYSLPEMSQVTYIQQPGHCC